MHTLTALILAAAEPGRGGQDPGGGLSALLIVLVVLGIVLAFAAIFFAFHKLSGRSKGGVEPVPGERKPRGNPPFESIARRR
jgi:hypothetical protein